MKKVTTEDFIKKAREIHGDKYDYSKVEYIKRNQKVCIICPVHGEFWQTPGNHLCGNGCSECSGKKKSNTEDFIKKAKEIHGDRYDYSKVNYVNNETPVCIICPEHGEFWQTPYNHIKGCGCQKCAGVIKSNTEEFVKKAKEIHGDRYDYSNVNYTNSHTVVQIICPEHGEFLQQPTNHLRGCGCPYCNTNVNSKIVQKIEKKLKELNITFEKEKTFDWLKNKSHMFIDFFLPEYNVGIECQGIQHFKPITFFGGNEKYNEQKSRDLLKYKLCSEHNIKIYYFTDINLEYFEKIYCNENILIEEICKLK